MIADAPRLANVCTVVVVVVLVVVAVVKSEFTANRTAFSQI